ncbi:hypothetical protein [Undibacterium sp.]|uniref:COG4315 family predicted lipoprotein n=1 Tax=Undibacterium sp. TaxID=1914977 RepID=UPI00374D48CD
MKKPSLLGALLVSCLYMASASAQEAPVKQSDGTLVSASGMTLYTFDKDTAGSGKSVCNGGCATLWPPAMAAASAKDSGDFTVVTRDDGSKQWALKGKPLYAYAQDKKAGDRTGDNFKDVWHAAKN